MLHLCTRSLKTIQYSISILTHPPTIERPRTSQTTVTEMSTPNEEQKSTEDTSTTDASVAPIASQQEENDDENEKTTTASTIVCSFCGLPETLTRNFDKLKCPCKSTQYCNTTCQRNHWLDHKKNCQHLIAEQKRKKQIAKEQRQRNANASGVNSSSTNATGVEEEQPHDSAMLKKMTKTQPKNNSKSKEKEEADDECPICLENLPKDPTKFVRI